ncbi:hypothetical protein [Curtobacterium sp. L1-20]|uniref:hypothetical protein n=1 Tax=Curtobacterium sp. L1-20 TaxID=3138181 RepID=UPI003B51C2C2
MTSHLNVTDARLAVAAVLAVGLSASMLSAPPAHAAADDLGSPFTWEKIRALGGAAAALGAELLGIAAVKQKCFS